MSLQTVQVRICDTVACSKTAVGQCILCGLDVCEVHGKPVAAVVMAGNNVVNGRAEGYLCPICLTAVGVPNQATLNARLKTGLKNLLDSFTP